MKLNTKYTKNKYKVQFLIFRIQLIQNKYITQCKINTIVCPPSLYLVPHSSPSLDLDHLSSPSLDLACFSFLTFWYKLICIFSSKIHQKKKSSTLSYLPNLARFSPLYSKIFCYYLQLSIQQLYGAYYFGLQALFITK